MMKAGASRGDIKFSNNPQFPFLGCREKMEIVENVKFKTKVYIYSHNKLFKNIHIFKKGNLNLK